MDKEQLKALGVPEDLHGEASLAEIKDLPALAKSYVETKRLVGASIRIPGKDASAEDQKAFREKLKAGVPDLVELPADPAKFAEAEGMIFERLGRPKDVKEYPALKDLKIEVGELKIDETQLRTYAHKLGMTKKQFAEFAKEAVAEKQTIANLSSESRKALRTKLGDAFDDRLLAAANAAKKFGASDATVTAIRTGNVPDETAEAWMGVAKATGTPGSQFNGEEGGSKKMTPGEAKDALAELRKNPALMDKTHPDQKRLTDKLLALTEIAYST